MVSIGLYLEIFAIRPITMGCELPVVLKRGSSTKSGASSRGTLTRVSTG